jgi:acylaminoacyl-peptidase
MALMAAAAAVGQGAGGRLGIADVFQFEQVSDPQISPDGKRVVYVRQFADIHTDRFYSNLWIVDFDGGNHRALTSGNFRDTAPRWSPDGSRLAYLSDREDGTQIWVRWMDTGQVQRASRLTEGAASPVWSPDGKQIAFLSLAAGKARKIGTLPEPPAGAKWADPPTVADRLLYRFDGSGYLKPGFTHLFTVPAEGGTARQISSGDFPHGGPGLGGGGDPVWAPDSKSLLLSANRHPDFELEPLDTEIYEFRLDGGEPRPLTRRKGPDRAPALSPDGRRIAYLGFDDRYQGYQVTRLYVMNRDGSGARVALDLDRDASNPRWAADGSAVFFTYDDNGNTKLALAKLDGGRRDLAGNIGGGIGATPGGTYSVARNGAFALTYSRPDIPSDVAVGTAADPSLKRVTAVNDDLLAGKELGSVEEIWYESSKDKRKIEGWIVKPPGFDPSKKYPLVLEIHGGPFSNYGDRFDFEKQTLAAKGFVVLYTNPRGSTSYGEEFGNLIHHKYPGDDFYDLNSGVDAVAARGYVDTNRLFVTGGSGGGVLTCWTIGHTARFRAAAAAYPVINWYSWVLSADIAAFGVRYWFPGYPWDHAAHYESRSLLSVVKNVKTPTLVLTGEEDYRTPISESEQYYQALKLLGVDAALMRVPGEPHGIRRRPSHWMSKMAAISGWFEEHDGK